MLRRTAFVLASLGAGVAAAWICAGLAPFTWPDRFGVGGLGAAVLLLAWVRRPVAAGEVPSGPRRAVGLLTWTAMAVAVGVFELVQEFSTPRVNHPTLSSLVDPTIGPYHHSARAAAILAWAALGLILCRRAGEAPWVG